MKLPTIAVTTFLLQASCASAASGSFLEEEFAQVETVGDVGFSFSLPKGFGKCELVSVEGVSHRWSLNDSTVSHSRFEERNLDRFEVSTEWSCPRDLARDGAKVSYLVDPARVLLTFDAPEELGVDEVAIRSGAKEDVCRLADLILQSYRFVDHSAQLRIDYIAPDQSYAVVINENGLRRLVKVGDHVSRAQGYVQRISSDAILVHELAPDDVGGYTEIPVEIRVSAPGK